MKENIIQHFTSMRIYVLSLHYGGLLAILTLNEDFSDI